MRAELAASRSSIGPPCRCSDATDAGLS
jgi:hypothetical protein